MSKHRELLIGCGTNKQKKLGHGPWQNLITLDYAAAYEPDVIHDLTIDRLPFEDNTFDELHAYEVLEHLGYQGDWEVLFWQFSDYWRVLKPEGKFYATVPCWRSVWAFGEPGHSRVINEGTLTFLRQTAYDDGSMMTPSVEYRAAYYGDFETLEAGHYPQGTNQADPHSVCQFVFVLKAIKPSRRPL